MGKTTAYRHTSRAGLFRIELQPDSRWKIWCERSMLGSYHSAPAALEALCTGTCDWPGVTDTSTLGLPDELAEWQSAST